MGDYFGGVSMEYEKPKRIKNWMKIAIVLVVVAILFANPTTRAFVHFILPLGSGVDDIIEIVALIGLVLLLIYKGCRNRGRIKDWFNEDDHNEY